MPDRSDTSALYIGLMSGTSTDGIDGVLACIPDLGTPTLLANASLPFPLDLRDEFLALNSPGENELARASVAGVALARLYSGVCNELLAKAGLCADDIVAIGAHGQTVRHAPDAGYTIQLNAPATLVELTGIDVIADFRSRDIAAQGQGAPLVPAFHQQVFQGSRPRAVLNLGGIANITVLDSATPLQGFDTGPANILLDMWCQEKTGQPFDDGGKWAATGTSHNALLTALIDDEPWFAQAPPKSTGRDLFNRAWLQQRLRPFAALQLSDSDIQATLQSLTVTTVAHAIARYAPHVDEVIVCGGGANNHGLMAQLQTRLGRPVKTSNELGVPAELVEALAFAWLAKAHVNGVAAGVPGVTGARGARILGCRYPA